MKTPEQKALLLGTLAFTVSFAIWGLLAGLMPILKKELALSAGQASLLVAIPVILGSLGRIPIGILADRFGGRKVFSAILLFMILPAVVLGFVHSYEAFLICGLFLGVAGTSFAVGVSFVSRWFPASKQGSALGIYGAGNIGQSIAVFGAPALASALGGMQWAVWAFSVVALLFAIYFLINAEDAPWKEPPKSLMNSLGLFFTRPRCWLLSMFYFQTFGGFVALSIYMPMLLKDIFDLPITDAGFRTGMFVLLATGARPIGGFLSDKFGGGAILSICYAGLLPCAFMLTSSDLGYFTVGALGAAFLVGLGNGGVFRLVPEYFPKDTGSVTGLVGAAGGMGGFFPPLVLGFCKDHFGTFNPGFYLLALFSLICWLAVYFTILKTKKAFEPVLNHPLG
ncbi:MAG: MFS transporter [Candidatus Obscuribacterales bacterium]|nr:MFS transporter [Candidatus Obscuribacterales bacterium]